MADAAAVAHDPSSQHIIVETSRFGSLRVEPDKVITMISPFLGFPESRRFFLKPHGADSPFWWLQSLDNPSLAFVVLEARRNFPDYQPPIPAHVCKELGDPTGRNLELLVILTIPRGRPREMTANLLGPVVIHSGKRLARQVLLDPDRYPCGFPLFPASQEQT